MMPGLIPIRRLHWKAQRQALPSPKSPLPPPKWSLRWCIKTQTDGAGERRAFQARGGLSIKAPLPLPTWRPHWNRPSRQGLWRHQHAAQWQAQVGPQVLAACRQHTWWLRYSSFKEVNCIVYELYLDRAIIFKKRIEKGRKREREGGREERRPDP